MWEPSSSAQPSSPHHSRPSSPPNPLPAEETERNEAEAAANESSPLQPPNSDSSPARVPAPGKWIPILTRLAMFLAVFSLVFLIIAQILMATLPYGNEMPWMTRDALSGVVIPALFSIFICAVNLARIRRNRPLAPLIFNIPLDILIAAIGISYAAMGLSCVSDYLDYGWGQLPVRILIGIAMGMVAGFGICHVILLAVRCRMAYLMESWRTPWLFPSGQLTFEVSIKFFKEPQKPQQGGEEVV